MKPRRAAGWALCLLLAGCVSLPAPAARRQQAVSLAAGAGWAPRRLATDTFVLTAFAPREHARADTLTLYIEGDGLAWISRSLPSADPTPLQPLALQLALRQPTGAAAYLARPCQYAEGRDAANCATSWWTSHRFAPDVIRATNQAIDQLKQEFQARQLVLVGYSGGGAVAALAAAQRQDVALLVTVAGNLDTAAWAKENKLTPLRDSLNPADAWPALAAIPQHHFAGADDRAVAPAVAQAFAARFPPDRRPEVEVIPGFDHHCCWVRDWPALFAGLPAAGSR